MMVRTEIPVKTSHQDELIDITSQILAHLQKSGIVNGLCTVFVPHTTAAVTINENADPDVQSDMLKALNHFDFNRLDYRHSEGNSPAHIKSSLIGCSINVIVENGRLLLGTWQGIYFCEFDGPRTRKVYLSILSG